ncbi:hypothetical protein MTO96_007310 [Rhipicephalus appendiculatus]
MVSARRDADWFPGGGGIVRSEPPRWLMIAGIRADGVEMDGLAPLNRLFSFLCPGEVVHRPERGPALVTEDRCPCTVGPVSPGRRKRRSSPASITDGVKFARTHRKAWKNWTTQTRRW